MTPLTRTSSPAFTPYTSTIMSIRCSETKTPFDNEPCTEPAVLESWATPGPTEGEEPFVPAHATPEPRCAAHHRIFVKMCEKFYPGCEVHERPIGG